MAATCASLLKPSIELLRRKTHLITPAVLITAGLSLTVTFLISALNFSAFHYVGLVSLEFIILQSTYKTYTLYFANLVGCPEWTGVVRRPSDCSQNRGKNQFNFKI